MFDFDSVNLFILTRNMVATFLNIYNLTYLRSEIQNIDMRTLKKTKPKNWIQIFWFCFFFVSILM